jgi:hypothetical protein
MSYATGLIGLWMLSDGILSWTLYLNAPSYEGSPKQTFLRDHWVRLVRILGGIALMAIGGIEIYG